jgi:hypothetical protein
MALPLEGATQAPNSDQRERDGGGSDGFAIGGGDASPFQSSPAGKGHSEMLLA